jgi:serine/threonine kinase 32
MKAANFDVSHELDEFLMVEKPLTHTKRKANADLDKLKPELRELEEKFVPPYPIFIHSNLLASGSLFTTLPTRNGFLIIRTTNPSSPSAQGPTLTGR